jgi:hypothetical protein
MRGGPPPALAAHGPRPQLWLRAVGTRQWTGLCALSAPAVRSGMPRCRQLENCNGCILMVSRNALPQAHKQVLHQVMRTASLTSSRFGLGRRLRVVTQQCSPV